MIKTKINRHDLEYYLYAMIRAFFPEEDALAPDTAEHNKPEDKEGENEDLLCCELAEGNLKIQFLKGQVFKESKNIEHSLKFNEDADEYKDEVRGLIYDALADYTKKQLRWGNLTGIRPTKLYLNKFIEYQKNKNGNDEYAYAIDQDVITKVIDKMHEVHRVGDVKGKLASDIALLEKSLIDSLHTKDGYSVYIGIPFCPSRCLYCSFTSNPIGMFEGRVETYIEAIKKELLATKELMKDHVLDTIYIGGGTPTALSSEQMDILLNNVVSILPMENVREFTVEAGRPDSITREKLEVIKKYPVTRISINPQTMKDETLKAIGRKHTVEQFRQAYALAREIGFENINMDIILGLPGENINDVHSTVDQIVELKPESLTVHSLAIKRASRLKEVMDQMGNIRTLDFDRAMDIASEGAGKMDMKPYYLYRQKDMGGNLENTGFSVDGKFGLYNVAMMEEVQTIIACGAGTVTKRVYGDGRIERCDNVKDVALYISKIEEMIDRKRQLFAD